MRPAHKSMPIITASRGGCTAKFQFRRPAPCECGKAEQIIIMGRHPDRIALTKELGATDVVSKRGEAAIERVRELTGGFGVHSVLECVGTEQATDTSVKIARPGGAVGCVGVPHYEAVPEAKLISVSGGPAPTRAYIAELLPDVMEGRIEPGRVFDHTVGLDGVPDGYRAMNEREAVKVRPVSESSQERKVLRNETDPRNRHCACSSERCACGRREHRHLTERLAAFLKRSGGNLYGRRDCRASVWGE